MNYFFSAFDVHSLEQAKSVVLSPDSNQPFKFQEETDFLVNWVGHNLRVNQHTRVLDYGCGMGRVSRALIERFQCPVIGLDISQTMLMYAMIYINQIGKHDLFHATTQYHSADSVDLVLAILSLQHAKDPRAEIDNIVNVLRPQGRLVLVNAKQRFVPAGVDAHGFVIWHDDGFDVSAYCECVMSKTQVDHYHNPEYNIIVYEKYSQDK